MKQSIFQQHACNLMAAKLKSDMYDKHHAALCCTCICLSDLLEQEISFSVLQKILYLPYSTEFHQISA